MKHQYIQINLTPYLLRIATDNVERIAFMMTKLMYGWKLCSGKVSFACSVHVSCSWPFSH